MGRSIAGSPARAFEWPARAFCGRKNSAKSNGNKVNLLIDIQTKLQAGKGAGYEKWAKLFNLKEAAKTLNFLTDNGLTDYDDLAARAEEAGQKFNVASARIKQVEARLSELSELRTHIVNYSKTRAVYAAFRKAKNKKDYCLAHESELAMHEAAKKAFDKLGGEKIPTVAQIQAEFSGLLKEKKELYETYKAARKEMIAYQTAKRILTVCCVSSRPRNRAGKRNAESAKI